MDPRGGAEFDENGPNLTEDVFWALVTTLVGSEGPEAVQSSGIESNTGERSDIISSWCRAAVKNALAKANNGNTDRGPILKVRDNVDQSIVGLVLHSHGRPKTNGADGWSCVVLYHSGSGWIFLIFGQDPWHSDESFVPYMRYDPPCTATPPISFASDHLIASV